VSAQSERAQRFTAEAGPVIDALGRRARRLTHTDADAEDLLQDTLLHAFRGFETFQDGTNLTAWLFRILHNRWVSRHRYRARRPAEVSLDAITDGAAHLPAVVRSTEVEVLELVPDGDVRSALAALSGPVRTAMYYVAVEGYTYAEAAALMDVPIGTVMSRVSRGRQRLRAALSHLDHGGSGCAEQRSA
jgi:RNA polymerase sigma factor (sigma-70 family)